MAAIVWLASYPKSGNTWVRVFLSNYIAKAEQPVSINDLSVRGIASSRQLFDLATGLSSSDLTANEIDAARPDVYRWLASTSQQQRHIKVHDAFSLGTDGQPMFPPDVSRGAIHIVRNPIDVAVSCAHHYGNSLSDAAGAMRRRTVLSDTTDHLCSQLRQRLGSWSSHARSWIQAARYFPVHTVRYEDLLRAPRAAFTEILGFSGIDIDEAALDRALSFSRLAVLQQQEQQYGFREAFHNQRRFFRCGKSNGWRGELPPDQVAAIVSEHADMMKELGYVTDLGELLGNAQCPTTIPAAGESFRV